MNLYLFFVEEMLAKTFLFVEEVLIIINVLMGLVLVHTNILSSPFSLSTACKQLQLQPELRHMCRRPEGSPNCDAILWAGIIIMLYVDLV